MAILSKQIQKAFIFKRLVALIVRLSEIPLTNQSRAMLRTYQLLSAAKATIILVFFGCLLTLNAKAGVFQAQFKSTACAQHEKYNRFYDAKECAQAIIKHSKDSIELVSAYAVLARVEDEFFKHLKADSLYKIALSFFPKNQLDSRLYRDFLIEIGDFHKAYNKTEQALDYLKPALNLIKIKEDRIKIELQIASCYSSLNPDSLHYYLQQAKMD